MPDSRRILLVEDDAEQQMLYVQLLSRAGYAIVPALDAEAAIEQMDAEPFHLLLTDLYLPGINGDALISMVRSRHPGVKTVLMSTHHDVARAAAACAADAWFQKGDIARLRALLAGLLAPTPQPE